jgi:hypothetical protein
MKSPFPGMDPYIEAFGLWGDFHGDLIGEIKRSLAPRLPERYFVQTGERAYVVIAAIDEKEARPIEFKRKPPAATAPRFHRVGPSGAALRTSPAGRGDAAGAWLHRRRRR